MRWPLALLIGLGALGCADRESAVVGNWKADAVLSDAQKAKPNAALMASLAGGSLRIDKEQHRFTRTFGNGVALEGSWTFDGKILTLTASSVNGHSLAETKAKMLENAPSRPNPALARKVANELDKPSKLRIEEDGTMQSVDTAKAAEGLIVYRREGK